MEESADITKKLIEYLNDSKQFVYEQAPDLIQQKLLIGKIDCIQVIIISLIVISICIYLFFLILNKIKVDVDQPLSEFGVDHPLLVFCMFFCLMFALLFTVILMNSVFELEKIYFTPKIYLLDYFVFRK